MIQCPRHDVVARKADDATAPAVTGYIAQRASLGYAISIAPLALLAGSLLLGIFFTAPRDVEKLRQRLAR